MKLFRSWLCILSLVSPFLLAVVSPRTSLLLAQPKAIWPAQATWSIATGWANEWPTEWHTAQASKFEQIHEWKVYNGKLTLQEGDWLLRDSVRTVRPGLMECVRRWEWAGEVPLDRVTLLVQVFVPCESAKPFLPAINYYGNPSGRKIDESRVPFIGSKVGDKGFYEEHRFSMPFAAVEATDGNEAIFGAALHSQPSPIRYGQAEDQWWSLGMQYVEGGVQLALYSGAVASNRKTGLIKAKQKGFVSYPDAYCRVEPGAIIEKRFWIETFPVKSVGQGFRQPIRTSAQIFSPDELTNLPSFRDVVRRKFYDTLDRWREGEGYAGFDAFPDGGINRPWIDLGWAGQSEAAAFPLMLLGEEFQIPQADELAVKATDFIASKAVFDKRGFRIRYDYEKKVWLSRSNPLSQAQAMDNLLSAYRLAKQKGMDTAAWETFLKRAAEFHASRILQKDWMPGSTNEAFLVKPLVVASQLFEQEKWLRAARKAADHYGQRHVSMQEPYWGGTLDARCEDKEGAWAALQAFLAMYEETQEPKYLQWASHAADVVLSYVYVWDVPLPPGRLRDHDLRTRGWTSVSVQNMHLDVFGVIMAPSIWRLGELDPWYEHMAKQMIVGCGQLVDAKGVQGEQLHQTNYVQKYEPVQLKGVRGDYVEEWNVFWITAHFLNAAAQFEELGVNWRDW